MDASVPRACLTASAPVQGNGGTAQAVRDDHPRYFAASPSWGGSLHDSSCGTSAGEAQGGGQSAPAIIPRPGLTALCRLKLSVSPTAAPKMGEASPLPRCVRCRGLSADLWASSGWSNRPVTVERSACGLRKPWGSPGDVCAGTRFRVCRHFNATALRCLCCV